MYKLSGKVELFVVFDDDDNKLPYTRVKDIEKIVEDANGCSFQCDMISGTIYEDFEVLVDDKDDEAEVRKAYERWIEGVSYEIRGYRFDVFKVKRIDG